MKKVNLVLFLLFLLLLASCSGSSTYQGKWKATDPSGNKFEIEFLPKSFSVKDSIGETKSYDYTQNSINVENSVETYGIRLSDGRAYAIHFPIANDESVGVILDGLGKPAYTICRADYRTIDNIYKLK